MRKVQGAAVRIRFEPGGRAGQRGLATLEAAVWSAVLLPVVFMGIALYGFAHDHNIVQMIPESFMREASGKFIRWHPDGAQGYFDVDTLRLDRTITTLADRAFGEIQNSGLKVMNSSARACYWVYTVDSVTGQVALNPFSTRCQARGTFGGRLNLRTARDGKLAMGVAKQMRSTSAQAPQFVPLVVVLGVAVGGRFSGLERVLRFRILQHGAAWVPREDVYL